jgi:DNA-binding transcriptional MerR regulator
MLKHELMKKTGLTRDTIRHYEKMGLLQPNRLINGYFDYPLSSIARVELIKHAKLLGMPLREIANLIIPWENKEISNQDKVEIFKIQLNKVDNKINALLQMKKHLQMKLEQIEELISE